MITTNYIPLEKETETVSFNDDDLDLTGRYIVSFTYKGTKHEVERWSYMLIQLCKILYSENPIQMNSLAANNCWLHDRNYYNNNSNKLDLVAENCYVFTSCSTKTKCSIISYIFEQLGINPSDLEFELRPMSDKTDTETNE